MQRQHRDYEYHPHYYDMQERFFYYWGKIVCTSNPS